MSNYKSWTSEERFFNYCSKCGIRLPVRTLVTLKKSNVYNSKILIRLCEDCYLNFLDLFGVSDIDL